MALATRCPHCQTSFRVANDQLKLHAGLVRCGSCQQTFNGVEHLIPLDVAKATSAAPTSREKKPAPTEESSASTSTPAFMQREVQNEVEEAAGHDVFTASAPEEEKFLADKAPPEPEAPASNSAMAASTPELLPDSAASLDFLLGDAESDTAPTSLTPADSIATQAELESKAALLSPGDPGWSTTDTPENINHEVDIERSHQADAELANIDFSAGKSDNEPHEPYIGDAEAALEQHAARAVDSDNESTADLTSEEKPDFVIKAEREQKRGRIIRIAMGVSCLLLLPLLLLQAVYIFRVQIAANYPNSKAILVQACGLMHCEIPLPAQKELITLESNELELQPDGKIFSLVMQLQNNGTTQQAWPHIELVLNDEKEKAVLQKAFTPNEYLTDKVLLSKGFTPKSQQNITVYFELPKLKAAGYHVSLFYP